MIGPRGESRIGIGGHNRPEDSPFWNSALRLIGDTASSTALEGRRPAGRAGIRKYTKTLIITVAGGRWLMDTGPMAAMRQLLYTGADRQCRVLTEVSTPPRRRPEPKRRQLERSRGQSLQTAKLEVEIPEELPRNTLMHAQEAADGLVMSTDPIIIILTGCWL